MISGLLLFFTLFILSGAAFNCTLNDDDGISSNGTCLLHNETTTNSTKSNLLQKNDSEEVKTKLTPPISLKSMDMMMEEQEEQPKGRALNFTIDENSTGNILQPSNHTTMKDNFSDLSDVTISDEEDSFEHEMQSAKILAPKLNSNNSSNNIKEICEMGGLTYENGEKLEKGCDSICTCTNGKMDCAARCLYPYTFRNKKLEDPLCTLKQSDDPCCALMVCAVDSATETLEICHWANKTYQRGEQFNKGCEEICTCETAGKISCKLRCPPVNKTSENCVEVPDPNDSCCKKIFCDVNLDDHVEKFEEKHKLLSAKYINLTTVELNFDRKLEANDNNNLIEASENKKDWRAYEIHSGKYVQVYEGSKFLKLENSDEIIAIKVLDQPINFTNNSSQTCSYSGKTFELGEEYNDNCTALCVCKEAGMKCLKLECPTYFGVDVLDPNCIEWETIPPNFVPKPPNCCAEEIKCKSNGTCLYEGQTYQNWQQLPINITGCDRRCYCEMGKIECQKTCPPVTAIPPPDLGCRPDQAILDHLPDDDCCTYWMCNKDVTEVKQNETRNTTTTDYSPFGFPTTKSPSKILGPLVIYTNKDDLNGTHLPPPQLLPNENPFFSKANMSNSKIPNTSHKKDNSKNQKPQKNKPPKDNLLFVTPPSGYHPSQSQQDIILTTTNHNYNNQQKPSSTSNPPPPPPPHQIQHNVQDELLQFIHQHPEITSYPSGSVLEIHNIPPGNNAAGNNNPNQKPPYIMPNNRPAPQVIPYVIPTHGGSHDDLPPGITLEQIIHEIQRNAAPPTHRPQIIPYPGPVLIAPQSIPNATYHQAGQIFNNNYPSFEPQEEITVHSLQSLDPHTVRLTFLVPGVIVGLHGRVEVRYTDHEDNNFENWQLQVFAPPGDLISTPQLEFDLLDLKPDTEYKIKITITLRDVHNTPTSRVYKIRTQKGPATSTLPPMIPIEPELAITDINATWVTVIWRKFTEYELQFIDGVQLRYKELDGKIYSATPLIHRSVTSYTLENLKPNAKYEIGIFFIPFPGQLTELHSEHMLHFTTANEINTYGFNVTLDISHIKSTSVEISWSGVPYPEDKYVNIYRAIYQSDSGKEDQSTFKIAKRDSATKTIIMDLKPGTRYRLWLEVYLTNGKIKTSNVQDFITKPRAAIALGAASQQGESDEPKGDYYGPLVVVAILASIAILSTLILLLILIKRHNQNKAAITPPSRVSQSAYDNPTYKVEIQQETMGL